MENLPEFLSTPMGVAVAGAIAFCVTWIGMLLGHRVEDRRKAAAKLGNHLSAIGLIEAPEIFACYSVGDLSGGFREAVDLIKKLEAPDSRRVCIERLFKGVVTDALRDPELRPRVEKFFKDTLATTTPDRVSESLQAINMVLDHKSLLDKVQAREGLIGGLLGRLGIGSPAPAVPAITTPSPTA